MRIQTKKSNIKLNILRDLIVTIKKGFEFSKEAYEKLKRKKKILKLDKYDIIEKLTKITEKDPSSIKEVYEIWGKKNASKLNIYNIKEILTKITEKDPKFVKEVCEILGEKNASKLNHYDIKEILIKITEKDPKFVKEVCKILGKKNLSKLYTFDIIEILTKIIEKDPSFVKEVCEILGEKNLSKLDKHQITKILTKITEKDPKFVKEVCKILGEKNLSKLDIYGIKEILTKITEKDPRFVKEVGEILGEKDHIVKILEDSRKQIQDYYLMYSLYYIMRMRNLFEENVNNLLKDENYTLTSNEKTMCKEFLEFFEQQKDSRNISRVNQEFKRIITTEKTIFNNEYSNLGKLEVLPNEVLAKILSYIGNYEKNIPSNSLNELIQTFVKEELKKNKKTESNSLSI